jgi:hypothetical protein
LVLGQDLLGEAVLELDMKRRRARLVDPDGHVVSPALRPVAVERSGTALTAEVTIEGAVMRAVIDTGFSSLIALSQGAAEAAGLLDGRPEKAGSSIVLGGTAQARVIETRTITFGDDLWRGVATPVFANSPLPNYPDALLGVGQPGPGARTPARLAPDGFDGGVNSILPCVEDPGGGPPDKAVEDQITAP